MRRLIVHVPELEYLPGGAEALPRPLARMLGRGQRVEDDPGQLLGAALGVGELPAPAVLTRLAADEPAPGSVWLRFDAVGMVPDLTAVWVEKPLELDFGADRMQPVTDELRAMFTAEGLHWYPESGAGHGLLELDSPPETRFVPLAEVSGRRLDQVLPEGPGSVRWRRLVNESQMVFHQFRSLAAPDQRGAGLWFWGAGSMPPKPAPPSARIFDPGGDPIGHPTGHRTGEPTSAGLARWLGVEIESGGDALPPDVREDSVLLRWSLHGRPSGNRGDPVEALRELGEQWLEPACGRLHAPAITVVGSTGGWHVPMLERMMFWRRAQPAGFAEKGG